MLRFLIGTLFLTCLVAAMPAFASESEFFSSIEGKWAGPGEIAGHLHPGARVIRRGRSIRRPCFATDGKRLVMPAFGAFTGTLNVLDKAWRGIFRREELTAYLMGPGRLYPIPGSSLAAG